MEPIINITWLEEIKKAYPSINIITMKNIIRWIHRLNSSKKDSEKDGNNFELIIESAIAENIKGFRVQEIRHIYKQALGSYYGRLSARTQKLRETKQLPEKKQ